MYDRAVDAFAEVGRAKQSKNSSRMGNANEAFIKLIHDLDRATGRKAYSFRVNYWTNKSVNEIFVDFR